MTHQQISKIIRQDYLSKLESYEVKNLGDLESLHQELINIRTELYFKYGYDVHPHYRGEQLFGRNILPGIFRPPFSEGITLDNSRKIESNGIEIFKERVEEKYGKKVLFKNIVGEEHAEKWDLLFQAQHAGIKTNLIDLSTSIYHSAFFACEPSQSHDDKEAQLWCLLVPSEFIYGESTKYDNPCYPVVNPFNTDRSFVCNVPTFIDDIDERTYQFRLFRQHGRLFVSSDNDLNIPLNQKDFWRDMILRVKIAPENKRAIYSQLNETGIDHDRLILNDSEEAKQFIRTINEDMKKI